MRNILLALFLALASAAPAAAQSPAEAFVQNNIGAGLAILNNNTLPKDQKRTQFRSLLLSLINLDRLADYTLGPVKNTASPGDVADFENAFGDYASALYETEFNRYSDQTLRVTGSVRLTANAAIVTTQLTNTISKTPREPTEVDFRVFGTSGNFTIGDVTVMGVDLAVTEQDQVQAFLWQHHNNVEALVAEFKQRAARMRADS